MKALSRILCLIPGLLSAQSPVWTAAPAPWARELGSHRVVVTVAGAAEAVQAHLDWHRRDREPGKKAVWVYDLTTGQRVMNALAFNITALSGDIVFQPVSGPGDYAVYFLPCSIGGGAFPVGTYQPPQETADAAWTQVAGVDPPTRSRLPTAKITAWQALSAHDAWNEMEIVGRSPTAPFVRLESAEHPLRMVDHIPRSWESPATPLTLTAQPNQYLAFQIVVGPGETAGASTVSLHFSELAGPNGATIPADRITCFQLAGVDWLGQPWKKDSYPLIPGKLQSLWCGLDVPRDAVPGRYQGTADVAISGGPRWSVPVPIKINGPTLEDRGDANPSRHSRLRWLNSPIALDAEPAQGYTPIAVDESTRTLHILGRTIALNPQGLPEKITSHFNRAVTRILDAPQLEVLRDTMTFSQTQPASNATAESARPCRFTSVTARRVEWEGRRVFSDSEEKISGALEADGHLTIDLTVTARADRLPAEYSLTVPLAPEATPYAIGMGREAGVNSPEWDWHWDVTHKNQDSVWIGAPHGGLRIRLHDEHYRRPSVNIHYLRRPLVDPASWSNGGRGGVRFAGHTLTAFSGPRPMASGEVLHFGIDLLITPFHPLHTREQWTDRYYHTGQLPGDDDKYLDSAKAAGATIINIHQGNRLNPYINYPFLTATALKAFTDKAHARHLRVKFYYTVRELTNWTPELFAFRSLGDEILLSGKGGGHPWLEEHLGGDYWGAWYEPTVQDASVLTQPMSRFNNYYIEGLKWLIENSGCDGIYLDDISFDRSVMERARKVLDRHDPRGGLIDLHSWNEFHDGGAFAQCANLFMDSMPFIDRLWFGEGHHYSGPPPEHFLVEISGIPFGLMGEMLEGGGNPWLGLVHGCTGRLGWGGHPRPIWKLWDDFGAVDSDFIGWWAGSDSPVQTGDPLVKATIWKKPGRTLLAVANFAPQARKVTLQIDWQALGLDGNKAKLYAPPISELQQREAVLASDQPIAIKGLGGLAVVVDESDRPAVPTSAAVALDAILWEDTFAPAADAGWKMTLSPKAEGGLRFDGGLVLTTPAHTHAYLERPLPAQATAVSVRIWQDPKDAGQQWGPGIALLWSNGKTLKVNRRQDGQLGVSANGGESLPARLTASAPLELVLRWDETTLRVSATGPAMGDLEEEIARFSRTEFPGPPTKLRLGKMPNSTQPLDFSEPGEIGFNRFEWVRIHGSGATPRR